MGKDKHVTELFAPASGTTLSRRAMLARAGALGLSLPTIMTILAACDGMHERRMMDRQMPDWMMSESMAPEMMEAMPVIRDLLLNHERIMRHVEDIPDGIQATTTSQDSEIADLIQTHVWQMKERMEEGRPIRQMDPVFRELFRHHTFVELDVEELPQGVHVAHTSTDPEVQLLIRQHAYRAVNEFVEYGMQRARQPTPLPEDYEVDRSQNQSIWLANMQWSGL